MQARPYLACGSKLRHSHKFACFNKDAAVGASFFSRPLQAEGLRIEEGGSGWGWQRSEAEL